MSVQSLNHLAIILDGNRRWAKAKGLPTFEGHRQGYEKMKQTAKWCADRGIKILTVYAFSSENWNRTEKEVGYLLNLFREMFESALIEVAKDNVRLKVIGQKEKFPQDIQDMIARAEERTKENTGLLFQIGLSYGGRPDILQAVKRLINEKIEPEAITEELLSKYLWTQGEADPDLIVRTSGEYRLSNFLTWQSAYSELMFLEKNWPDFSEKDLDSIIEEFKNRQRRFGK